MLVTAKTRVAPLKKLTVPKLELCGAALLAEVLTTCREALQVSVEDTFAWCDSTIALAWLRSSPAKYKTFVANRIATAARLLPPSVWKHVPTLQNPADCASRGVDPRELKEHELWWRGPPWLSKDPVILPPQPQASEIAKHQSLETKPAAVLMTRSIPPAWWLNKFKSYRTLLLVVAWMKRFVFNIKSKVHLQPTNRMWKLIVEEVDSAEQILLLQSQERCFPAEQSYLFLTTQAYIFYFKAVDSTPIPGSRWTPACRRSFG